MIQIYSENNKNFSSNGDMDIAAGRRIRFRGTKRFLEFNDAASD